jgi:hypothetical protein
VAAFKTKYDEVKPFFAIDHVFTNSIGDELGGK